jgi:hypothetical protein
MLTTILKVRWRTLFLVYFLHEHAHKNPKSKMTEHIFVYFLHEHAHNNPESKMAENILVYLLHEHAHNNPESKMTEHILVIFFMSFLLFWSMRTTIQKVR